MPGIALAAALLATGGCADHLSIELDSGSFASVQLGEGPDELASWQDDSGRIFKDAANVLCEANQLDPGQFDGMTQLVVQYGAGADSATVWQDEAKPDAIILQYAFYPGSPAPDEADVRDAIICWDNPDESICADRMP